ncbi:MAG TPA: DUF4395 domain-containing protein [Solirubrobacteraceae bacterium]
MSGSAHTRLADPYRDTTVIDARAPRTNQTIVALVTIAALLTGWWWLAALMGLQLVIGLTLGRRWCLPCVLYFEAIQPRFGEGQLEDSRPPRFANVVGACFLMSATVLFVLGAGVVGWVLVGVVAALASLAALTGFCTGCWMYRLVNGECEVCDLPNVPRAIADADRG